MHALSEIQSALIQAVVEDNANGIDGMVAPSGLAPARRLQIYRNNFLISLSGALATIFPVLQKLVGERYFDHAARRFACDHPPTVALLSQYGESFPSYLASLTGSNDYRYLTDVGGFEWAINHAFHADDAMPEDTTALEDIPPSLQGELVLAPHPSARLIRSPYPVLDIWRANQPDADQDFAIDLGSGGISILVWRHDLDVVWRSLDPAETAFVGAILDMHTLDRASRLAAEAGPRDFDAGAFYAELLVSGLFIGHFHAAHN